MRRALAGCLVLFALAPWRIEAEIALSGYLKSFALVVQESAAAGIQAANPPIGINANHLRLNLSGHIMPDIAFQIAYDLSPRIQDPQFFAHSLFQSAADSDRYRVADFRAQLVPAPLDATGSFALYQNLDRFFITVKTAFADIKIGRQPIAWGSSRVVSPTDIIAPFTFQEIDKEERYGVDAVRIQCPLGALGEVDGGYVFGHNAQAGTSAFFIGTKWNLAKTDVALRAIGFYQNLLLGIDLSRPLAGATVHMEAAYTVNGYFAAHTSTASQNYWRLSIGADRSFGDALTIFAEYHFNAAGSSDPATYLAQTAHTAYSQGATYLLGRHYLMSGGSYTLSPLSTLSCSLVCNLNDASFSAAPQWEYNIAQNIYLAAGAFWGIGAKPVNPSAWRSEFGAYPDFYYLAFRIYF